MYKRSSFYLLQSRFREPRKFIQVIAGPRQIGKTTTVRQALEDSGIPWMYVSADGVPASDFNWIRQQWDTARYQTEQSGNAPFILVIDEIQKLENWSEVIKSLWDEDSFKSIPIYLVLLGSSSLLIQQGLSESLAGRFELIPMTHWSFEEMEAAFGFSAEQYAWFGGYPGSASLIEDESRWKDYVKNSLVETTISRDILMLTRVDKPALMKRLFELGCTYSGQVLSMNKMLGQLTDAGNTTTLSNYLSLLDAAGLLTGIEKFSGSSVQTKASIPKWQVLNPALLTAQNANDFRTERANLTQWGHIVESAVGSHLANEARTKDIKLWYWKEKNEEIDFVLEYQGKIAGIEVKSGKGKPRAGFGSFVKKYKPYRLLLVGNQGIPWQEFLKADIKTIFS